jgi:transcription elongation factor Elf1
MGLVSRCLQCGSEDIEIYWLERTRVREIHQACPTCGSSKAIEVVTELPRSNPWALVRCLHCGSVVRHGEYFYIDDWD